MIFVVNDGYHDEGCNKDVDDGCGAVMVVVVVMVVMMVVER